MLRALYYSNDNWFFSAAQNDRSQTHIFLLLDLLQSAGVDNVPLQLLDLVGLPPAEQLDDFLGHI